MKKNKNAGLSYGAQPGRRLCHDNQNVHYISAQNLLNNPITEPSGFTACRITVRTANRTVLNLLNHMPVSESHPRWSDAVAVYHFDSDSSRAMDSRSGYHGIIPGAESFHSQENTH
ncbi:MAG: hypothetical protein U5R06_12585 [candidate division KSB1 bacterium]|nr:hypothetical protein [candidate division KSB1 bacterium]